MYSIWTVWCISDISTSWLTVLLSVKLLVPDFLYFMKPSRSSLLLPSRLLFFVYLAAQRWAYSRSGDIIIPCIKTPLLSSFSASFINDIPRVVFWVLQTVLFLIIYDTEAALWAYQSPHYSVLVCISFKWSLSFINTEVCLSVSSKGEGNYLIIYFHVVSHLFNSF